MATRNTTRKLWFVVGALVLITGFAFTMSFNALTDLASAHDCKPPWALPLILDGAIGGFSVAVYNAASEGRRARKYHTLVVVTTGISVAFNMLHVWESGWTSRLIHALPPFAMYWLFDVLMDELRLSHGMIAKRAAKKPAENRQAPRQKPRQNDATESATITPAMAHAAVAEYGSQAKAASALKTSPRTIQRRLAEFADAQ